MMPRRKRGPKATPIDLILNTPYAQALIAGDASVYSFCTTSLHFGDVVGVEYIGLPKTISSGRGPLIVPRRMPIGTIVEKNPEWAAGKDCLVTFRGRFRKTLRNKSEGLILPYSCRVFDIVAIGERRSKVAETAANIFKNNYVNTMLKKLRGAYNDFTRKVEQANSRETIARRELVDAIKEVEGYRDLESRYRTVMNDGIDGAMRKFATEYDKLLDNHKIKGIILGTETLEVYTGPLYCKDPRTNEEHEIGEMKFFINMENGTVFITNLTRRVRTPYYPAAHAPHVEDSGIPCFGNIKTMVVDLIAKNEVVMLIELLVNFVESVNVHDSHGGAFINLWPLSNRPKDRPVAKKLIHRRGYSKVEIQQAKRTAR
jgi:hypothetical protein